MQRTYQFITFTRDGDIFCVSLQQPRIEDLRRPEPVRTVRRVHLQHRAVVEQVEDIQVRLHPASRAEPDDFRQTHVHLRDPLVEIRE